MKNIIIYIVFLLSSYYCYASHIDQISNITYDKTIAHFDNHQGAICRYEDRLYVENYASIDEYQILPNHQLALINYYEKMSSTPQGLYIKDGKLYAFDRKRGVPQMYIFNIVESPMILEATIESPMAPNGNNINITSYNDYLLFSEEGLCLTKKFNTITRSFEPDIYGMDILFTVKDSVLIKINPYINQDQTVYKLGFYNLNDCSNNEFGALITEYEFASGTDCNRFYRVKTQGDTLYVMGYGYYKAINIYDISNPETLFCGSYTYTISPFTDMFIYDNNFYLFKQNGNFKVFDLTDPSMNTVIYDSTIPNVTFQKNSYQFVYPYLYLNTNQHLCVYQVDNGFQLIEKYGFGYDDVVLSNEICGLYDRNSSMFLFYNLMEENPTPQYLYRETEVSRFSFIFKDQKLILNCEYDGINTLEYYNTSVSPYQLISSHNSLSTNGIDIINDKLFVYSYNVTYIYQIQADNLEFLMSLTGYIQKGYQNENFFLICNANQLEFRDLNNPSEIIVSYTIPNMSSTDNANIEIINENYLLIRPYIGQTAIYYYNIEGEFYRTCTMPNYWPYIKNEILTIALSDNENISFKYIGDGLLESIGSYVDFKYGQWYFYPDHNRIINKTASSLNLYNFNYTVSTNDIISVHKDFVSVYPNPNKGDLFQFKMNSKAEIAELSIYNIKGQLINKTSAHQTDKIVWNSKSINDTQLSSGVYFYKLKTESKTYYGKFLKMK